MSACDSKARQADRSFTLKDMNGGDVRFADFKGKVIVLNVWTTWCGPCKTEVRWLADMQAKYAKDGLQVLGFSFDDTPEQMKPFAREFRINYPLLEGRGRVDVTDAYGPIWGVPMTFVIARDGRLCRKYSGLASEESFEQEIKALL